MKNIISSLMILIVLSSALGAVSASEEVDREGIIHLYDDDPNHNYTLKIGQKYHIGGVGSRFRLVANAARDAGFLNEIVDVNEKSANYNNFVPIKVGSVSKDIEVNGFGTTELYTLNFVEYK
jgi:hypothetical protein